VPILAPVKVRWYKILNPKLTFSTFKFHLKEKKLCFFSGKILFVIQIFYSVMLMYDGNTVQIRTFLSRIKFIKLLRIRFVDEIQCLQNWLSQSLTVDLPKPSGRQEARRACYNSRHWRLYKNTQKNTTWPYLAQAGNWLLSPWKTWSNPMTVQVGFVVAKVFKISSAFPSQYIIPTVFHTYSFIYHWLYTVLTINIIIK